MRKSTLFISAALTTFILAVLFGVASAYRNTVNSAEIAAVQSQPTTTAQMVSQPMAAVVPTQVIPTQVVNITPESAAAIAGKVLGRTDMYSVEVAQFEGADAYLVTFSSGDLVYVSLAGQVLSISKLPVTIINQPSSGGGGGGNHNNRNVQSSSGEHEGSDD
jgi:hypothetical protein